MVKARKAANAAGANGRISETTVAEGQALFDEAARFYLGISGDEFIRRWDSGDYDDDPDRPGVMNVAFLLPFVR